MSARTTVVSSLSFASSLNTGLDDEKIRRFSSSRSIPINKESEMSSILIRSTQPDSTESDSNNHSREMCFIRTHSSEIDDRSEHIGKEAMEIRKRTLFLLY
ncbi:hypothetical protein D3C73_1329420 [compost metagenome]